MERTGVESRMLSKTIPIPTRYYDGLLLDERVSDVGLCTRKRKLIDEKGRGLDSKEASMCKNIEQRRPSD